MAGRFGLRSNNWKGGKSIHRGYVRFNGITKNGKRVGRIYEHVWVMEQKLGRKLIPGEKVHHKNGVRSDNRRRNLELWNRPQPTGCRVSDQIRWAVDILKRYAPKKVQW